jgi:hypothetical protein
MDGGDLAEEKYGPRDQRGRIVKVCLNIVSQLNELSGPRSMNPIDGSTTILIRSSRIRAFHSLGTSAMAFQNPLIHSLIASCEGFPSVGGNPGR